MSQHYNMIKQVPLRTRRALVDMQSIELLDAATAH